MPLLSPAAVKPCDPPWDHGRPNLFGYCYAALVTPFGLQVFKCFGLVFEKELLDSYREVIANELRPEGRR
jgi:hypothetical protein